MAHLSIYRNTVLEGVFYLPDHQAVIGRADGVEIQLLDSKVSRRHAVVRKSVAGYMVQDLDTKNGTFVNKERVERSLLFHGDTMVIGAYTLRFAEGDIEELGAGFVATMGQTGSGLKVSPHEDGLNAKARTVPDGAPPPGPRGVEARRGGIRAMPVGMPEPDSIEVEGLAPGDYDDVPLRPVNHIGASIEISLPGIGRPQDDLDTPRPRTIALAPPRPSVGKQSMVPPAPWAPGPVAQSTPAQKSTNDPPTTARRVPDPRSGRS